MDSIFLLRISLHYTLPEIAILLEYLLVLEDEESLERLTKIFGHTVAGDLWWQCTEEEGNPVLPLTAMASGP